MVSLRSNISSYNSEMKKTGTDIEISQIQEQDYKKSLSSIVKKVEDSKHQAITTVNKLLIELYWFIGETIEDFQEKSSWGDGVVEKLSVDLRMRYPDMSGLSARNLWDCKRFYLTCCDFSKLRTLFAEISWSHNLALSNFLVISLKSIIHN